MNWTPVMVFYAKTTSWIIFPLIFALFLGKYLGNFVSLMVGFGITCFGLYREIKEYKKSL